MTVTAFWTRSAAPTCRFSRIAREDHELYLTLINGQVQTPDALGQIVVKTTPAGIPVRIGDIGTVQKSVKPVYTMVTANGKPAVLLNINRQPNSNTISVANEVHDEVERIRQTLPPGIDVDPVLRSVADRSESIKSVRDAIILGLILASPSWFCSFATGARRSWRAS